MSRNTPARRAVRAAVVICAGAVLVAAVIGAGRAVSLREDVLHRSSSAGAGVTYPYQGTRHAADLLLVEVTRIVGTSYELRLGPGADTYHYPVELHFGGAEPRVRHVRWDPDGVAVDFADGNSVHVAADNFRSTR
ncbi:MULTISPECIES: hypothetical protein [Prauserella salsuginis group]|uniref:Uncharacterized protein n=3 Tax=Prauserella salsuginis group TaxID=2893672 RepID=A0A839XPE0_9PSEU|nr:MULTISPECIES: hypothetical protein [Prauserella salsuginis group]MBB3663769.1 hypothetical protein [Prauserella sediminis]MCR3722451.1 hypothetical protein [Prauserella flava]MCR3736893.1 hypothetical protein [Prauserella salsuginis]